MNIVFRIEVVARYRNWMKKIIEVCVVLHDTKIRDCTGSLKKILP